MRVKAKYMPLFAFFLFVATVYAQVDRATISGNVTDPAGAAVPNVSVTVISTESNTPYTTQTNGSGQYNMPNLPIGIYTVTYEAAGFKKLVRQSIELQIAQVLGLDVQLDIGTADEVVNVNAQETLLKTENPEVGTSVSRDDMFNLPLSFAGGRQPEAFAYKLTPGAEGSSRGVATYRSRINGTPAFTKEVLLDGASVTTNLAGHNGETTVSMEALQEFRVQTSGLSAEYGRAGGGVFNFVMRSGANQVHGSLLGQLRNEVLNANSFSNNVRGIERDRQRQFNYGGSFGGPIYIPKIYDGQDKTFFYVAVEKYRERQLRFGLPNRTAPQLEMYDGNLSRLLTNQVVGTDALRRPIYRGAIYDPLTTRQVRDSQGRTVTVQDPFPGNIIPSNRISQVSRDIAAVARRSFAPINNALVNNSLFPIYNTPEIDISQYSLKIDRNISDRQKIAGSIARNIRPRVLTGVGLWDVNTPDGGLLSKTNNQLVNSYLARISHNYTFSPTTLNSFIISYNRLANPNSSINVGSGCAALLGIKGVLQEGPCPNINWGAGPAGVSFGQIGNNADSFRVGNAWGVSDTVTYIRGNHSFKFGIDVRGNQQNERPLGNLSGTFNFTPQQTGLRATPGVNGTQFTGHAFASFLLGDVNNASVSDPLISGGRSYYYSGFVQDDFKVTRKLTLNLGLRYEYQPPITEVADRSTNFNTSLIDPLTGMRGALEYAGEGAGRIGRSTFVDGDKKDFGPRVGFAYAVDDRTTLRAGYGLFYLANTFNAFSGTPFQRGFEGTNNVRASFNYSNTFNWDNGYPGTLVPAGNFDPSAWILGGVTEWDPEAGKIPYIQQWNFNLQRELPGDIVVDIGYVGNKSTGLWANELANKNQLDPQYLRFGADLTTVLNTDADAQRFGLSGLPYPAFRGGQLWQALVPFPHLARNGIGLTTYRPPLGFSTYNALQVVANRRLSNGFSLYFAYSFSKSLANMESSLNNDNLARPLNYYDLSLEKALAEHDRTHNFKTAFQLELPIGRGRRFLSDMNRWLEFALGGWTLSYIGNYASGYPLQITGASTIPGFNGRANRPTVINQTDASPDAGFDPGSFNSCVFTNSCGGGALPDANRYVLPGRFADNPAFTLGNAAFTSNIRGNPFLNEDIGIRKEFMINEKVRVEIRAELLNAFNRHRFDEVETGILSPNFGYVTDVSGNREGQFGFRLRF